MRSNLQLWLTALAIGSKALFAAPLEPIQGQPAPLGEPLIPAAAFFNSLSQEVFRLSPNGGLVAFIRSYNSGNLLCIGNPEALANTTRNVTLDRKSSVASFVWVADNLLAYEIRLPGGESRVECAYISEPEQICGDGITRKELTRASEHGRILGIIPKTPTPMLLLEVPAKGKDGPKLCLSDCKTGRRKWLAVDSTGIGVWNISQDGRVLAGIKGFSDGGSELIVFKNGRSFPLFRCESGAQMNLCGIQPDNGSVLVATNAGGGDLVRLERIDFSDGKRTVLAEDPGKSVDLGDPVFEPESGRLLGVRYFKERSFYQWESGQFDNLFKKIQSQLAGGEVVVKGVSRSGKKWLVTLSQDTAPDAEYFWNEDGSRLVRLDSRDSELPADQLGRMQPITYKSRDGGQITGYLTQPTRRASSPSPLLVFPHGGPNKRTYWGFDPRVQFLASRGYAVFQPNFRGSSGFGKQFQNAGNRQWGRGRMQEDITDGVEWLIAQGLADPKRIGIIGGSFGGFAALAGMAFTPHLYAAGVCLFGPSNLPDFVRNVPPGWKPYFGDIALRIGDPYQEDGLRLLAWQSPIYATEDIRAPLLIYQGALDRLVQKSQADRFVSACRLRGKPVEYLVAAKQGHGFSDPQIEEAVYLVIERFLANHLGGSCQKDISSEAANRVEELRKLGEAPELKPTPGFPNFKTSAANAEARAKAYRIKKLPEEVPSSELNFSTVFP